MKVLVTGGHGYLGSRVCAGLAAQGHVPVRFDLPFDVLDEQALRHASARTEACIHLAAHKHAAFGEDEPAEVAETNILGTRNVVEVFGPNVVLASTCKAADPMTCYGASKLIAERIVLNAGGRVARLVNVWGSSGSVAEIWRDVPDGDPIPVTDCERLWITAEKAVRLLVDALAWPAGRYAPAGAFPVRMFDLARETYPGRRLWPIPLRRGDRPVERLLGEYEDFEEYVSGVIRITHPADLPAVDTAALRAA